MRTKTAFFMAFLAFSAFENAKAQTSGLRGEYFDGVNFDRFVGERTDSKIDFRWDIAEPMRGQGTDDFSIRWTGQIQTGRSGEHLFRAVADDGLRVFIDGRAVIEAWKWADSEASEGKIWLEAGRFYDLRVEYFNAPNEGELQLRWQLPGDEPFFGGAFGLNDRPVPASAFFKKTPEAIAVSKPAAAEKALEGKKKTPAERPKPAEKVPPKVAEKPVAKPVSPAPTVAEIEKFLPKNVLFQQSKADFLPVSLAELERLAGFLARNPSVRLRVEGHTDTIGDRAQNLILSKQRAEAVVDFLIKKSIAADRLEHEGYGSERPLTLDETPVGCAKNRRVEFLVLE